MRIGPDGLTEHGRDPERWSTRWVYRWEDEMEDPDSLWSRAGHRLDMWSILFASGLLGIGFAIICLIAIAFFLVIILGIITGSTGS